MVDTISLLQKTLKKYRPANASNRLNLIYSESDKDLLRFYNSRGTPNRQSLTPSYRTRPGFLPPRKLCNSPSNSSNPGPTMNSSTKLTPIYEVPKPFRSQKRLRKILNDSAPPLPSISVSPIRCKTEMRSNIESVGRSRKELNSNNSSMRLSQIVDILNTCNALEEESFKHHEDLNNVQTDSVRDFKDLRIRLDAITSSPEKLTEHRVKTLKSIELKSKASDYQNFTSKKKRQELREEMLNISYVTRIKLHTKLPGLDQLMRIKKRAKHIRV